MTNEEHAKRLEEMAVIHARYITSCSNRLAGDEDIDRETCELAMASHQFKADALLAGAAALRGQEAAKAALAAEAWRIYQCPPTVDGPIRYRILPNDQNLVAYAVISALKLLGE